MEPDHFKHLHENDTLHSPQDFPVVGLYVSLAPRQARVKVEDGRARFDPPSAEA